MAEGETAGGRTGAVTPAGTGAASGPGSPAPDPFREALALHSAGRTGEAEPLYRAHLEADPRHAAAWTNLGVLHRREGRFGPAAAAHRKALSLDPGSRSIRNNLANSLHDDGFFEEAAEIRAALHAETPGSAAAVRDLAASLRCSGRHAEAIALVDAAEADGVADGECRLQRGMSLLTLGEHARGFADFEHRYDGDEVALPKDVPWPRWQGEPLAGRRIVVLPEQGFGDAILTARFLPRLKALGAHVTLHAKPPLERLLARVDGADRVVGTVRRSDPFDLYVMNMSLPHLVGLGEDGPPPPPRLTIPEDSRERARRWLDPARGLFRIGIVWTGSLTYRSNHRRSTGPEAFLGLASIPGVQLFSLYKGPAHGAFLASGMAGLVTDACGTDRDFADTAAVIEGMDLMVTTDTAVVHVAASMGKPVRNMLNREGFWLYGTGRTTPWYPSMRLVRQTRRDGWAEVMAMIEVEVRALAEERR